MTTPDLDALIWYHTIDLGDGRVTPGIYDHRPYLTHYGLPNDLSGRTALDIGAASGFFTFELEARGAAVTATDLPTWLAHDFGPRYQPDLDPSGAESYLHDPFLYAHRARSSQATRRLTTIYDITPASVGTFDLVFCGSVLLHLSDPIRALWQIRSVTGQAAIITTAIHAAESADPLALFIGQHRGDAWWLPNRAAFEAWVQAAGFAGWEWYADFQLDYRSGEPGPPHGVIRAWTTAERPAWLGPPHPAASR
jgi:tRNA (mo5U34)-methyltransferase